MNIYTHYQQIQAKHIGFILIQTIECEIKGIWKIEKKKRKMVTKSKHFVANKKILDNYGKGKVN